MYIAIAYPAKLTKESRKEAFRYLMIKSEYKMQPTCQKNVQKMKTYLYGGPLLDAKELQTLHAPPSLFSEEEYKRLHYFTFL